MEEKAPGVVKLFGEHAVVHGSRGLSAAVSVFATAKIEPNNGNELVIRLSNLDGMSASLSKEMLDDIYKEYASRESILAYKKRLAMFDANLLPYITIAARLQSEFMASLIGYDISISSEIPRQKGLASSAACSTAFTKVILHNAGIALPDEAVIDIARDGDRVVHENDNAGRVDVPPAYYGGIVKVTKEDFVPLKIKSELRLMLIDTGPKKPTSETVGNVTNLFKTNKEYAQSLCDQIDECVGLGIDALMNNDAKAIGRYMYKDQELLKELGVSSESIDDAVDISRETGMLGAKLSGGGGGGIVVAVPGEKISNEFYNRINERNYKIINTSIHYNSQHKRKQVQYG